MQFATLARKMLRKHYDLNEIQPLLVVYYLWILCRSLKNICLWTLARVIEKGTNKSKKRTSKKYRSLLYLFVGDSSLFYKQLTHWDQGYQNVLIQQEQKHSKNKRELTAPESHVSPICRRKRMSYGQYNT